MISMIESFTKRWLESPSGFQQGTDWEQYMHCTKNSIYTKFTQCKFSGKKFKLRLNKGQRW